LSALDEINTIAEFVELSEFVDDEDVNELLARVVKVIAKPDVPPGKAVVLINELQALSAKFAVLATWYTTVKKGPAGSPNNHKKNLYHTLRDATDRLVDALKYTVRYGVQ
jgi:hypothetical protein